MEIPQEIENIIKKLRANKYEVFVVGGCVRDSLMGKVPTDWDITTSAKPEEIKEIFPDSFYENKFLTVTVHTGSESLALEEVEITTFRSEAKYTNKRHPDEVMFAKTLEEDLSRRDFTVNALAIDIHDGKNELIDLFGGQEDLKNKIIRTVGNPNDRFNEDALRMMRAVRFSATLDDGWKIESATSSAVEKNSQNLKFISFERIRDELLKIIMSPRASEGIELLRKLGLLKHIIPELEENFNITQNKHHIYDCYEHAILSLKYAAEENFSQRVRVAALLHDIAKPRVKRGEGENATFYNHEVVGARMAEKILERLKFPKDEIENIVKLVRYHLFYYDVDEVGDSSIRRLVRQVGPENMEELLQVRMCDRIGSGVPKAEPYKLRHLKYVVDKVSQDPISAKMLKVSGKDIMDILKIEPGPKVGRILDVLLGYVLEDPKKNEKKFLEGEIKKLGNLSEKELNSYSEEAEAEREKVETKRDEMTKKKYWVT
ncbi:hypothetical protein BWK69_00040 [Candidatus Parcubacteria bacterium A4]|nr:MAG: hypothetical protein BWK69_00040 [Candidatus Parcubacteria bacterium A4]